MVDFDLHGIYSSSRKNVSLNTVYTLKDCCAATSIEGQEAAYEHTFGMFSVPTTSEVSVIYFGAHSINFLILF